VTANIDLGWDGRASDHKGVGGFVAVIACNLTGGIVYAHSLGIESNIKISVAGTYMFDVQANGTSVLNLPSTVLQVGIIYTAFVRGLASGTGA